MVEPDVVIKRRHLLVIGVTLSVLLPVGVWFFLLRPTADLRALGSVTMQWNRMGLKADPEAQNRLADGCLEVNRQYPGTVGGLSALLLAATIAPDTPAGQRAEGQFAQQADEADLDLLAEAFDHVQVTNAKASRLAPPLLARVRRSPDHPRCGRLLAVCCTLTRPEEDGEPQVVYREAADLLAGRFAASPDIQNFCEGLASVTGSPTWAVQFENHLRAILDANRDRKVRCAAQYALASVVMAAGEDRQEEAQSLFEEFCSDFDGTHDYSYRSIEEAYRGVALAQLKELKFRTVGSFSSEITGLDLEGRPLKLSDYRGRVVLLNFWGTWCFPCMKLVPHERELAAAHRGQPFEIVGVNCDDDVQEAREAVARHAMTWRSFRNQSDGRPAITEEWKVLGFPTLYLVDHHGIIRKRWVGSPPPDELGGMVNVLVEAARKGVPADSMKQILAAFEPAVPTAQPVRAAPGPAATIRPGTGFVDKVHRDADGIESKYTVFVPMSYDGSEPVPALLYLHGSGSRGRDGRAHLQHGLARAIRAKNLDFPFLVVFPQAREGEDWSADTPGGRRALAVLDQAQADYRIDPDRVALTGVSMGGAGTWSLGAAAPDRWSALVPISHGGDVTSVGKLVGIPCWCFHGADDRVIPPQQSREMVEAVTKAGGRPLYQEFPGVGHNDCTSRVYAMDDVYEWLLLQNRSGR